MILPFAILPILNHRLGPDIFGKYAIWISTATFITVLTDWGFNVYGVSEASRRSKNFSDAFEFLIAVSGFKLIVGILVTACVGLLLLFFSSPENAGHFLAAAIIILGGITFPLWFYNGIDKVGFALSTIVPLRVFQLFLLLAFVTTPQDLNLALFLAGMPQVLSFGLIFFIASHNGIRLRALMLSYRIESTIYHVARSTRIFVSSILSASFTNLSALVLSLFVSKEVVGNFYLADRAIRALLSLFSAFSSGVLAERAGPHYKVDGSHFAIRALFLSLVTAVMVLVCFFTMGQLLLHPLLGESTGAVLNILGTYIFIIPIVFASNVLGVQLLLSARYYSAFANNIMLGIVIYWILVFPVGFSGGLEGYLYLLLATEFFITTLMYRSCRQNGLA